MDSGLGKIIEYPPLWLCNAMRFICFICLYAFAYNIVELMGGLELFHQDNLCLFVDMRTYWGKCEVGALTFSNECFAHLSSAHESISQFPNHVTTIILMGSGKNMI